MELSRNIFTKSAGVSDVRGSAARPVLRRRGAIQGNSARDSDIQKNRHLLGMGVRNLAPRESAVGCVGIYPGGDTKLAYVEAGIPFLLH